MAEVCKICSVLCQSAFSQVETAALTGISKHLISINYNKGQTIFTEGNKAKSVFCIQQGKVKIFNRDKSGRNTTIRLASEGDIIGFYSIANDETYVHSAKCLEDATICLLPYPVYKRLLNENKEFLNRLFSISCDDYVKSSQLINSLGSKPVRERIAFSIILLSEKFGLDKDGFINIRITREEIANISGTITESVIRCMSEFRKEKLILFKDRKIKVIDDLRLADIASSK